MAVANFSLFHIFHLYFRSRYLGHAFSSNKFVIISFVYLFVYLYFVCENS